MAALMCYATERSIFYHVPKTGGRWVRAALRNGGLVFEHAPQIPNVAPLGLARQHLVPAGVELAYRAQRFEFCFVRHPVDWYRSYWCYRMKSGGLDPDFPLDASWDPDFHEFVARATAEQPGFLSELYCEYNCVDYVGRFEQLSSDLVTALCAAEEPADIDAVLQTPPVNVSGPEYETLAIVTPQARSAIEKSESWAMEEFGYA